MAKAHITTSEGISIRVEGTADEISALVRKLDDQKRDRKPRGASHVSNRKGHTLLVDLIASLSDGGFFARPRDLASVKAALEEMGHHYPVTSLSPTMLRQVRRKQLRRIRDKGRWMYTR